MSLDLELTGIDINELNIGSWKPPENKHRGYKDAVVYAVQKDREAREQRIEDNRANLYRRMSPQQRALLEAVARQAQTEEMKVKSGVDTHLEGLADTWAKHAGAILDEPFSDTKEQPFSDLSPDVDPIEQVVAGVNGVGDLTRTGTSHDWDQPPHRMLQENHELSDIDTEHRLAYCAAHGYRVRIDIRDHRNGTPRWRCLERDVFRRQARRPNAGGTYKDEPREPKCCGEGGGCPDCPFRDTSIVSETS